MHLWGLNAEAVMESGCTNGSGSVAQGSDEANGPSRTAARWVLNACNHLLGSGQPRVLTAGAKGGVSE